MSRLTALLLVMGLAASGCGGRGDVLLKNGSGKPPGAPRVLPGDLDARLLLEDLPSRAIKLGAGPVTVVASGEAVEGERLGAFVAVPADACLLAYARSSSSLDDIDVAAFADEGNPIATDEAPDAHPTILLCPPHPERVYLAVHAASGEGLVALAAHIVPRDRAAEMGRVLGARGSRGEGPRPADAWPGLDDHVRAHRAALGGTWEELRKVALTLDARSTSFVAFPIEANQCIDAVIVPDDEVSMIDVEATDGEGRVVARARDGDKDRNITICSQVAFTGSLAVRPHVGSGLAAVVVARTRGDAVKNLAAHAQVAWVGTPLTLDAARAARNAELAKAGYVGPTSTLNGHLALGRRVMLPLDLGAAAGSCSRIDVVAGTPLALVEASVWDPNGVWINGGDGTNGATLFVCGRAKAQLELETRGRPGPFSVLVRAERWKDPAFVTRPLAASRMLSRATGGSGSMHEGAPLATKVFTLDPTRRVSYAQAVPPGQCLRVAVGVEGEGSGVELRLFDGVTSEELDRESAEIRVSGRACAPAGTPRQVRVEIRGGAGKLEAVVGERLTTGG
jgi:hypothetical protein